MKACCDCYVILREERRSDLKILRKLRMTVLYVSLKAKVSVKKLNYHDLYDIIIL